MPPLRRFESEQPQSRELGRDLESHGEDRVLVFARRGGPPPKEIWARDRPPSDGVGLEPRSPRGAFAQVARDTECRNGKAKTAGICR